LYLNPALAIVLIFIGSKMFVADFLGLEKFQ
jgi:tellurite resistance protein TerC